MEHPAHGQEEHDSHEAEPSTADDDSNELPILEVSQLEATQEEVRRSQRQYNARTKPHNDAQTLPPCNQPGYAIEWIGDTAPPPPPPPLTASELRMQRRNDPEHIPHPVQQEIGVSEHEPDVSPGLCILSGTQRECCA